MQVRIGTDGIQLNPVRGRYAFPPELDLMARLAGLRLEARWGGWDRRPFTADSEQHVSVYARDDG
ncbi:MAG: SAM-dependent methyltransferase, partial [Acidimicrobiia bacterium]